MTRIISLIPKTFPIMLGYIPLGMAFGFLITKSGLDWFIAPLFSLIAFAGAIQFLAIPMLISGESYLSIAVTTILVNFRHIFYGISLLNFAPKNILKKIYFIFCVTDENYSLLTSAKDIRSKDALLIVALNHTYWITGALLGAIMASQSAEVKGLDFALTALFCVLFIEQYKSNPSTKLVMIAVASAIIASATQPSNFILFASILATVFLTIDYGMAYRRAATDG